VIQAVNGGFRLFSKSKPSRALGPVRRSKEEVAAKDEKRVTFFKNLAYSSGGPGSLKAKVKKKSLVM
tara:strand:- start:88 stop:288 length:201 start_codon:yes stop_codon:yes gene_type:complete